MAKPSERRALVGPVKGSVALYIDHVNGPCGPSGKGSQVVLTGGEAPVDGTLGPDRLAPIGTPTPTGPWPNSLTGGVCSVVSKVGVTTT